MKRSARELEAPSTFGGLLREGLVLTGQALLRSPMLVGGTTAFLVAMSFVTANALWYQPHFHDGAFFETRAIVRDAPPETPQTPTPGMRPHTEANVPAPPRQEAMSTSISEPASVVTQAALAPNADPKVRDVQQILRGLNLYDGAVDGLSGPKTMRAIENYRRIVGLEPGSAIDEALLRQLGVAQPASTQRAQRPAEADLQTASIQPPLPQMRDAALSGQTATAVAQPAPDPRIVRIQAGLRAFGNDGIELDGVVGTRTKNAIKEFQSLFGLPVTGTPDEQVYAKMREIGLTE